MKIAKYVGELLFDYECVVIPGLGGFIAEDKSVSINRVTDKFSPPYRKIHFNIHLRANDGLLVNHVAQYEKIGYKSAKQRVDNFVHLCHKALEDGKKINFKYIGAIYYDEEKNVVFEQDEEINYNADSFGLTDIVSPSIRRETDEEKVKKVVKSAIDTATNKKSREKQKVDRKEPAVKAPPKKVMKANRRKSSLTNQVIFLMVVIMLMGVGYIYMKRDAMGYYFERYYSHVPLFYTSVNDYFASNINSTPVAKLSRGTASFFPFVLDKNENLNLVLKETDGENETLTFQEVDKENPKTNGEDAEIVIIEPTPENIEKPSYARAINEEDESNKGDEIPVNEPIANPESGTDHTPVVTSNRFFIIAGSFSKETNAKKLVTELKGKGFKAMIADTNKYGMYRVAIESFNSKIEAERKLVAIRKDTNPKAWVLEK